MQLTTFSNLSPSEFLQLNQEKIPPEIMKYLKDLVTQVENLQDENYGVSDEYNITY